MLDCAKFNRFRRGYWRSAATPSRKAEKKLTLALFTAGLSAAIAGFLAYRVAEDRGARSTRSGKAEELHRPAEALDVEAARFFDPRCAVADSNRQLGVAGDDPLPIVAARLADAKMLVGFCFSQLSTALARCVAAIATAEASLRLWERSADAAIVDAGARQRADLGAPRRLSLRSPRRRATPRATRRPRQARRPRRRRRRSNWRRCPRPVGAGSGRSPRRD